MWQKFKSKVKKGRNGNPKVTQHREPDMADPCQAITPPPPPSPGPESSEGKSPGANRFAPEHEPASAQGNPALSAEDVKPSANALITDSGTVRRRGVTSAMHGSQSSMHQCERMVASCCDMEASSPSSSSGLGSCRELRLTLPVVRSPNKSMERPLGQVFLVFRGETKRAILPNEVTSIDTVRALFVRSFPKSLSMRSFDSPFRKIYIHDATTNVFYELDDLGEIKDRTILKIFEQTECLTLGSPRPLQQRRPNCETTGRTTPLGLMTSATSLEQASSVYTSPQSMIKSLHSLLSSGSSLSPQQQSTQQQTFTEHQRPYVTKNCLSPSPGPPASQRHSVACIIPEPATPNNSGGHMSQSHSCQNYAERERPLSTCGSGTVTPSGGDAETINRMQIMESQLASLTAWVHTAMHQQSKSESSCNKTPVKSTDLSAPSSAKSSVSDVSTCTPEPVINVSMVNALYVLRRQTDELRSELNQLRCMQVSFAHCIKIAIQHVFEKITSSLVEVTELKSQPCSRTRRLSAQVHLENHRTAAEQINEGLRDLDQLVEDIRKDVVSHKCRVNITEVESLALALSNISRSLADLRGGFPELHEKMKSVMKTEAELVIREEKFLREEPLRIEESLKKSRKLMGTLLTLKKLASVQEKRPVLIPSVSTKRELVSPDRQALLLTIESTKPDHKARMQSLEEADATRERKKKITGNITNLRFEKALELAQRHLRETDNEAINAARQEQTINVICQRMTSSLSSGETGAKDHTSKPSGPNVEFPFSSMPLRDLDGLPNHLREPSEAVVKETKNTDLKLLDNAEEDTGIDLKVDSAELVRSDSEHTAAEILDRCDVVTNTPDTGGEVTADSNVVSPSSVICINSAGDDDADHCAIITAGRSPSDIEAEQRCPGVQFSEPNPTHQISNPTQPMSAIGLLDPTFIHHSDLNHDLFSDATQPTINTEKSNPNRPKPTHGLTQPVDNSEADMTSEERLENSTSIKSPEINTSTPSNPAGVSQSPLLPSTTLEGISNTQDRTRGVRHRKEAPPPPPRKTVGHQGQGGTQLDPAARPGTNCETAPSCRKDPDSSKITTRPKSVFGLSTPNSESTSPVSSTKLRPTSCGGGVGGLTTHAHTNTLSDSPNSANNSAGNDDNDDDDNDSKLTMAYSDSEDSSLSSESQTGTIKKRTPLSKEEVCDDKAQKKPTGSNGHASRVPPPVPLRKTSTLSTQGRAESPATQHQYSNLQELRRERALLEKHATSLANGNVASGSSPSVPLKPSQLNAGQNSKMDRRECEETEIY